MKSKSNYKFKFIKINGIAGNLYFNTKKSNESRTLVIYGIGAPKVPDDGNLPDAKAIMEFQTDLFVPDYIGFGRSDGKFTPMNCIYTFTKLYKYFIEGCIGINTYEVSRLDLKYERVIFIGKSFAGDYIPLLPRFNKGIKELAIVSAVADSKSQGSIAGEESNELFLDSINKDGYKYLYRGITDKIWISHLEDEDDLAPYDNINYLADSKFFIGHGKLDVCVHYSKSIEYYEKIIKIHKEKKDNFKLKLYSRGDHGSSTTNKACYDFLKWIGVNRVHN